MLNFTLTREDCYSNSKSSNILYPDEFLLTPKKLLKLLTLGLGVTLLDQSHIAYYNVDVTCSPQFIRIFIIMILFFICVEKTSLQCILLKFTIFDALSNIFFSLVFFLYFILHIRIRQYCLSVSQYECKLDHHFSVFAGCSFLQAVVGGINDQFFLVARCWIFSLNLFKCPKRN